MSRYYNPAPSISRRSFGGQPKKRSTCARDAAVLRQDRPMEIAWFPPPSCLQLIQSLPGFLGGSKMAERDFTVEWAVVLPNGNQKPMRCCIAFILFGFVPGPPPRSLKRFAFRTPPRAVGLTRKFWQAASWTTWNRRLIGPPSRPALPRSSMRGRRRRQPIAAARSRK